MVTNRRGQDAGCRMEGQFMECGEKPRALGAWF
jgi:hypothetical protein